MTGLDGGHEWDSQRQMGGRCPNEHPRVWEPVRVGSVTRWIITVTDLE